MEECEDDFGKIKSDFSSEYSNAFLRGDFKRREELRDSLYEECLKRYDKVREDIRDFEDRLSNEEDNSKREILSKAIELYESAVKILVNKMNQIVEASILERAR